MSPTFIKLSPFYLSGDPHLLTPFLLSLLCWILNSSWQLFQIPLSFKNICFHALFRHFVRTHLMKNKNTFFTFRFLEPSSGAVEQRPLDHAAWWKEMGFLNSGLMSAWCLTLGRFMFPPWVSVSPSVKWGNLVIIGFLKYILWNAYSGRHFIKKGRRLLVSYIGGNSASSVPLLEIDKDRLCSRRSERCYSQGTMFNFKSLFLQWWDR